MPIRDERHEHIYVKAKGQKRAKKKWIHSALKESGYTRVTEYEFDTVKFFCEQNDIELGKPHSNDEVSVRALVDLAIEQNNKDMLLFLYSISFNVKTEEGKARALPRVLAAKYKESLYYQLCPPAGTFDTI